MAKDRALVLGGGGPVGIAWEAGLAAGLKEGGVDLARADFILGTSAGSFVGAQLAGGRDPASLAQAQIAMGKAQQNAAREPGRPRPPAPDLAPLLELMAEATADEPTPEFLQRLGAFALKARTISEADFLRTFGSIAEGGRPWPARFACTAVDAESGHFRMWSVREEIPLAHGIASSCSVPGVYPPIAINGRKWIDGGMRSGTNADLAAGHRRVLIVAVIAGDGDPASARAAERLARERAAIEAGGGVSELIRPDAASLETFGPNLLDARRRADVAQAGIEQGRREAARLAAFWN